MYSCACPFSISNSCAGLKAAWGTAAAQAPSTGSKHKPEHGNTLLARSWLETETKLADQEQRLNWTKL